MTNLDKTTKIQCALRLEFDATNNEAKYKAIIIALELPYNLEIEHMKVFSDSQLVVGQIQGTLKRKDKKKELILLKCV